MMGKTIVRCFCFLGFAVLVLLALMTEHAQAEGPEPRLAVSISGGLAIPVPSNWHFVGLSNVTVEPHTSYGFGIAYGPLPLVAGTGLILSTELTRITEGIDEKHIHHWAGGTASLRISTTGIMAHGTLLGEGRMTPFVRLGLGAARVHFAELYSAAYLNDIEFDYWHFSYNLGAGIRYRATPRVTLLLFCDSLLTPGERLEPTSDCRETGIFKGATSLWAGLGLNIQL
jgi:hypothetical protein